MANHSGNNGTVSVAGNVVAELLDMSWDEGVAIIDNSALADAADTHLAGSTNWKGSVNCFWDETDSTGQEAMTIGASLATIFNPDGNVLGDITYTGTATIESIGMAVTRNGMIMRSFGIMGSGALVKAVIV